MKKFYIPYIVFSILLLSLFAANLFGVVEQPKNTEENKVTEFENKTNLSNFEEITTESKSEYYTVKSMDNNIYLFDKNNKILDKLDIDYKNLREYDKNQFKAGIQLSDKSEIFSLIEDFSN